MNIHIHWHKMNKHWPKRRQLQLARPIPPGTVGAGDSAAFPVVVLMSSLGGDETGVLAGTVTTSWTGLGDGEGVGAGGGVGVGAGVGVALRGRQLLRAWPPA